MRKVLLTCVCSMLLLGLWSVNAAAPNFAGTWVLDKGKSELPPQQAQALKSLTWTITQDDKQITVTPKAEMEEGAAAGGAGGGGGRGGRGGMMGGGNQPRTFKLDGSETVTENQRGKTTIKAKLSDGGLEINTVRNMNMQGNEMTLTTKEHWTLADGGKTLKVHSSTETPQGARETNQVFTKQ
jgi:hypothetical protein